MPKIRFIDHCRVNHSVSLKEELAHTAFVTRLDPKEVKRLLKTKTHSQIRREYGAPNNG